jgi:hypothetical protein
MNQSLGLINLEQFTRHRQIHRQRRGVRAIDDPEIAVPLALTDDQKQKLTHKLTIDFAAARWYYFRMC